MTPAATLTHCPTCGMKITRQGLSICSYCSAPIGLEGGGSPADGATAQRLGKIRKHKDFPPAMAWNPPEEPEVQRALLQRRRAFLLAALAVALMALALLARADVILAATRVRPLLWAGTIPAVLALLLGARSTSAAARVRSMPLLRRPVLIRTRRSETTPGRGPCATVYFFDLEFEDGSGEFRFPGRGAHFDPWVPGNTGIAYTRRDVLLELKLIRV